MLSVNLIKTAVLITHKAFPYPMPVKWQQASQVSNLPPNLHDWLLNTGSLTERLQALTTNFNVYLLGQQILPMDKNEAQQLASKHTPLENDWQIREVILQGETTSAFREDNTSDNRQLNDWVFARSILPNELCQSKWANLGNQPLGARIFNDNNFVRSGFEIGRLEYHPLSNEAFEAEQECWARRSKFTIGEYELLVAEAFLPDCPCYR